MNKVKASYEGGVCPDCQEEVPNNAKEGSECSNCGHVFYSDHDCDDGTCPDCFGPSNKCICSPKEKGL